MSKIYLPIFYKKNLIFRKSLKTKDVLRLLIYILYSWLTFFLVWNPQYVSRIRTRPVFITILTDLHLNDR